MQEALHNKWQLDSLVPRLVVRLDLCWLHCHYQLAAGVLLLATMVHCSIFFRNDTSVTLQNRSTVSANFGLIDMPKFGKVSPGNFGHRIFPVT